MGKIEILEDYNKPFVFQGRDYLLNYDPDTYAVEAVEKYWSDKILPLSVEIQGTSHDWGNDITKEEAEELAKDIKYRESFDICTARAVARLNTLSEYCMPFVKPGGNFIAFKADAEEEIKEAMNAVKILGGKLKGTVSFDLFGNKRTVVVINKVQKTPEKYPRGNGKERKKPL